MASMDGMVPITRAFLASYYDKYLFIPLSDDVSRLTTEICSVASDLCKDFPPIEAASVASQWLELLHQDTKGRLAAFRRSKKRDQSVIHTELPLLMSREFSCNQKNDPYVMKNSAAGCSNNASVHVDVHQARWSALFEMACKIKKKCSCQITGLYPTRILGYVSHWCPIGQLSIFW